MVPEYFETFHDIVVEKAGERCYGLLLSNPFFVLPSVSALYLYSSEITNCCDVVHSKEPWSFRDSQSP